MKISNICMDALNKVKDWWLLAYLYLAYNAMEPCKLFCNCAFNWVFKSEINGVTHTLVRLVKLVNRTRKNFLLGLMKVWLYYPQKGKKIVNVSYSITKLRWLHPTPKSSEVNKLSIYNQRKDWSQYKSTHFPIDKNCKPKYHTTDSH